MNFVQEDGTGSGNKAKVDSNNRQSALADSRSLFQFAAQLGDTFNFNTGTINLISGLESAVAFFQNNSVDVIVIPTIGLLLGNSVGGVAPENLTLKVIKNPKTGTIINDAVPVDIFENKNAGSNKTFNDGKALQFKGAEAKTFTDGIDWFSTLLPGAARQYTIDTGDIVLPPAASIGITVTPQASNTGMALQVFMAVNDISNAIL